MIQIDGSYLEGGGQIIRTALSLSSLTREAFKVENIRKGRTKPGLKNQHLYAIKTLKEVCNGYAEDAFLGSSKLTYIPREIKGGQIEVDIQTAGSITLVLQAILMPLFFANQASTVTLKGGTDTKWSQPIDYFIEILIPQIKKFCKKIDVKIMRRGYYPKGQGKVIVQITPEYKLKNFDKFESFQKEVSEKVRNINLTEQGELVQIRGVSHASKNLQQAKVAERQADAARLLIKKFNKPIDIRVEYCDTESTGSGIILWAIFSGKDNFDNPIRLGSDALGEKGVPAEKVGQEAAEKMIKEIESGQPVDQLLADNLIPWLIFGGQFSTSEMTLHSKTNVWVVNQFIKDKLEIKDNRILSH